MEWNDVKEILEDVKPILKATSDAICILDKYGNTIYENPLYEIMLKRGNLEIVADSKDIYVDGKKAGKVIVYHDISEVNRLRRELDRLNQKLRKVEAKYSFKDIIGENEKMLEAINVAKTAAMTPATIMLRGESGTGKEIFANAIHNTSPRRNEKFVKINCSSIPDELLESELFGYKEGAFTGAQRGGKKGLFQEADRGSLFLDEIGDVSPRMQVKILRALQEKEIMPVGSTESIPIDVRIICATNKPLEKMIEDGEFREDLYYRLNVFPIKIPPLRERKDDIEAISMYLLNQYNDYYGRKVTSIDKEAIKLLKKGDWPGNVRELQNVLSRALINLSEDEEVLTAEDIEASINGEDARPRKHRNPGGVPENIPSELNAAVEYIETTVIKRAIEQAGGDKNKAAVTLGIPLRTLYYKCKKLGI
ncbi:MAG: sigma 54-interacting transcriptional regulator [Firmicutes bacterium]|nr:sigma 54-interacting transcriptional regulator [Bacillota bacterium]